VKRPHGNGYEPESALDPSSERGNYSQDECTDTLAEVASEAI
jgi:hypothetical protein